MVKEDLYKVKYEKLLNFFAINILLVLFCNGQVIITDSLGVADGVQSVPRNTTVVYDQPIFGPLVVDSGTAKFLTVITSPPDQPITWSSSNTDLVDINSEGRITASSSRFGTATITATAENGSSGTYDIIVVPEAVVSEIVTIGTVTAPRGRFAAGAPVSGLVDNQPTASNYRTSTESNRNNFPGDSTLTEDGLPPIFTFNLVSSPRVSGVLIAYTGESASLVTFKAYVDNALIGVYNLQSFDLSGSGVRYVAASFPGDIIASSIRLEFLATRDSANDRTVVEEIAFFSTDVSEVTKNSNIFASGSLSDTFPSFSTEGGISYGTFNIETNGSWVYTLDGENPTVQSLRTGEFIRDIFRVRSGSVVRDLSIKINGKDDIIIGGINGDYVLWLDARDLSTLSSTISGTGSIDGAQNRDVGVWRDKSTYANHLRAEDVDDIPKYDTVKGAVRFDRDGGAADSSDFLSTNASGNSIQQNFSSVNFSFFFVYARLAQNHGGFTNTFNAFFESDALDIGSGSGSIDELGNPSFVPGEYRISSLIGNSGTFKIYLNNTDVSGGIDTTYNSSLSFLHFSLGNNLQSAQSDISEVIVLLESVNTSKRLVLQNYLSAKWLIPLDSGDYYDETGGGTGTFSHEVGGILRFSASDQSLSTDFFGGVRVENRGGINESGDALFIGHNGGQLGVDRRWYFDITDSSSDGGDFLIVYDSLNLSEGESVGLFYNGVFVSGTFVDAQSRASFTVPLPGDGVYDFRPASFIEAIIDGDSFNVVLGDQIVALPNQNEIRFSDRVVTLNRDSGSILTGFREVILDDSVLIPTGGSLAIIGTSEDDVIRLLGDSEIRGEVDGGLGNDSINIGEGDSASMSFSSLFSAINFEFVNISNNVIINDSLSIGSARLKILDGGSISLVSGGVLSNDIEFEGITTFTNTGGEINVSSLTFGVTTYNFSSTSTILTVGELNVGDLSIRLDNGLDIQSIDRVLFDGVLNVTGDLSTVVIESFGGIVPESVGLFRVGSTIVLVNNSSAELVDPAPISNASVRRSQSNFDVFDVIVDSIADKNRATISSSNITVVDSDGNSVSYDASSIDGGRYLTLVGEDFDVGDVVTFQYTYVDYLGRSLSNVTYTINIVENIPATVSGTSTGEVIEDTLLEVSGVLTSVDADGSDNTFIISENVETDLDFGRYSITVEGEWSYVLNNDSQAIQQLGVTDTLQDTFTIRTEDDTEHIITITIRGIVDDTDYAIEGNEVTVLRDITDSNNPFIPGGNQVGDNGFNIPATANRILFNSGVQVNTNINIRGFSYVELNPFSSVGNILGTTGADTFIINRASFVTLNGENGDDTAMITLDSNIISSRFSNIEKVVKDGSGSLVFTENDPEITDLVFNGGDLNLSNSGVVLLTNITFREGTSLTINFGTPGILRSNLTVATDSTGAQINNSGKKLEITGNVDINIANSISLNPSSYVDGETFFVIATGGDYEIEDLEKVRVLDRGLIGGRFDVIINNNDLIAVWNVNEIRPLVSDNRFDYSPTVLTAVTIVADLIDTGILSSQDDQIFISSFVDFYDRGTLEEKKQIVESLVPIYQVNIVPAIENITNELSVNLNKRSFGSTLDTGFVNLGGPNNIDYNLQKDQHFWYDLSYNSGSREGNISAPSYDYNGYSLGLGYDHLYADAFLGVTFSFSQATLDNGGLGEVDINTLGIGLYGRTQKDFEFISATLIVTTSDISTSRNVVVSGDVSSDSESSSFDFDFNYARIRVISSEFRFTNLFGFRYNLTSLDGIVENMPQLNTRTEEKDYQSLYFKISSILNWQVGQGVKTSHNISMLANWSYNVFDTERNLTSQFTSGGDSFEVNGVDEEKHSFAFGVNWQIKNEYLIIELGYTHRFSSILKTNLLTAKVQHNF